MMQSDYAQNLDTIIGLTMNIIRRAYVIYQRERERERKIHITHLNFCLRLDMTRCVNCNC